MAAWRAGPDHLVLSIRVTPRSSVDRIEGSKMLADGTEVVAVRVRAVPESGAANEAVIRLLAGELDIARRIVSIVAGHQARLKQVRIDGDPVALSAAIGRLTRRTMEG